MGSAGVEGPVAATIAGGFVLVPVAVLVAAWEACRSRPLGVGDFRTWLAAHELRARRSRIGADREAVYGHAELARLRGVSLRRTRASVGRLVKAGLLVWSETAIAFPDRADPGANRLEETIGRGRGSLVFPRRILRFLVAGGRPALIATVLGLLFRGLSRRRRGFDGRGRVKAGWIAGVFAVNLRRVKAARRELVDLGWIKPRPSDQRAWNRWGAGFAINLAWDRPRAAEGRRLPPPRPGDRPPIATPSVDQDPLPERENHQEPARGGPAGVSIPSPGEGAGPLPPPSPGEGAGPLPPPRLDDVRADDLKDTGRLLAMFAQAVARGLVGPSEADRLRFVAAAEHARAIGTVNPAGLFAHLVRGRLWRYLTMADEDAANARIRAAVRGRPPDVPGRGAMMMTTTIGGPTLSADARLVREIRTASIRAGFYRDPFPTFQGLNPDWTRERWDRAGAEFDRVRVGR